MTPALGPSWTRTQQGVNAWLDQERDSLGLAFLLTGAEPEPWTPLDSVGWQKVQAWNVGANMDEELFRYLADARLGDPARTDELFPPYPDGAPVIVPGLGETAERADAADVTAVAPTVTRRETPETQATGWRSIADLGNSIGRIAGLDLGDGMVGTHGVGSNNWVVAPSLTTTGGALLANDPDLGISMPSIWFLNGLHCAPVTDACPYDVAGRSFPGVPGGRARPQRAYRMGRHERRNGRPGPVHRAGRPGRPNSVPVRRRIPPVRDQDRGDPGQGRVGAGPPGGPFDRRRTDPQRC